MLQFKQSTATKVTILLAAGGTSVTGLTNTDVEAFISKNGAAPGSFALTGVNFTELSAADMPGLYVIDLAAADTDTLGELIITFKDPLVAGTFDQYNVRAQIFENDIDDVSSQVAAINANIGGFNTALDEIKGAGFNTGTDSLKAISDDLSTNITGPVALAEQIAGAGGTQNAPAGVGLWDVLGDGSVTLTDLGSQIGRILGLTHENFGFLNQVYDGNNNLISATVKLYPSRADTLADTNATHQYTITATYNAQSQLTSQTMVLDP